MRVNPYEVIMMVMFGAAWPISIIRSLRTKTSAGRSVPFYLSMIAGYVAGILHKLIYSKDYTLIVYIVNLAMVIVACILTIHYRKRDRQRSDQTQTVQSKDIGGGA